MIDITGYKLVDIAQYFSTTILAHDAQSDIRATREIAYKLLDKIKKISEDEIEKVELDDYIVKEGC